MAQNRMGDITNAVYAIAGDGTKDEMKAVASCFLRSSSNYQLGDMQTLVNEERLSEMANGKFKTEDNETKYKQSMSLVSALMRGTLATDNCDFVILKSEQKSLKESGALDTFKKTGSAGRFNMYSRE